MERRQSIKAVARKSAIKGMFQASLTPVDTLTVDDIAQRWAIYSGMQQGMAKSQIVGFESFILDLLANGFRLDFGLVSFYPRMSGGLSSIDADPEADGLYVRGAVKAKRALVNGLKNRLVAENALTTSRARIHSVIDDETGRIGTMTTGRVVSVAGSDIVINPKQDDEGIWLEKRRHDSARGHSYVKVARGRIVQSDNSTAKVVFDEPVPKGKYLLTLYTRCGRGASYKATLCRREVNVR
ncbi:MAG: DUF4469 domain-containing protein [Kiritimatiellae bacterium]|nr:DUF4469 domain-containing protein [Kiritimatiellia bacterium]